jgi:hypothetical protein
LKAIGATKFSYVREDVKRELESVKIMNLYCQKPLPGNGW